MEEGWEINSNDGLTPLMCDRVLGGLASRHIFPKVALGFLGTGNWQYSIALV